MPDLRQDAALAWLATFDPERPDGEWPPAMRAIENEGGAPVLLEQLGVALDRFDTSEVEAMAIALRSPQFAAGLRAVLAQMGSARPLRLLHWFGEHLAEPHSLIAALTEGGTPEAGALRAALAAITRHLLLARLFTEERLAALAAYTEIALQEPVR